MQTQASMESNAADSLDGLSLLASALAGRDVQVSASAPRERTWTDRKAIYVGTAQSAHEQIAALVVQAALLAAGSVEPDVMRQLTRRPALARRYLAVEGHRALAAMEALLPPSLRSLIDRTVAARSDSPLASLAIASSKEVLCDPPACFGEIRARRLLDSRDAASKTSATQHVPREQAQRELQELAQEAADDGATLDMSSPVGGGGGLGRWLQKFTQSVRQIKGGGPPGADAPTHISRTGLSGGASIAQSTAPAQTVEDFFGERRGFLYPEWDHDRRGYRRDWCTVLEVPSPLTESASGIVADGHSLRRPLARLGMGLDRFHRQAQGDDIDIDAAIEARVDMMAGSAPEEAVYVDSLRRRRDLSVLVLLDVSGSVAQPASAGETVHERQRAAAAALVLALHDIGDRVALYAFHSQGRTAVHFVPVKRFDETPDMLVLRRLQSLVPGAYSRLGAAIRHGSTVLQERGGTSRRLLVVLSDGLAYDHGYEPAYGAADSRRALAEARRDGVGCLCLTIGAGTDTQTLRRVFGSAAHAVIPKAEHLSRVVGPLFRSALRSAEVRRRVAQGERSRRESIIKVMRA